MDFGLDERLFPSEIHTVEAIGKEPGINVTELAREMGVTKGAVSQMIRKLVTKNLVTRLKGMRNEKEVLLELTPRGRQAFQGHEKFHAESYNVFLDKIKAISTEDIETFERILSKIETVLDVYISDLIQT